MYRCHISMEVCQLHGISRVSEMRSSCVCVLYSVCVDIHTRGRAHTHTHTHTRQVASLFRVVVPAQASSSSPTAAQRKVEPGGGGGGRWVGAQSQSSCAQGPAGTLAQRNMPFWGSDDRGTPVQGWHSLQGRKEARGQRGPICILPGRRTEPGPAGETGRGSGSSHFSRVRAQE